MDQNVHESSTTNVIRFVGIDVGISNIALVCATVQEQWFYDRSGHCNIRDVLRATYAERVNMKDFIHRRITLSKCTLYHEKTASDRVDHFIQEFEDAFRKADEILVERQPITGLTDVEQLLFRAFRDKVKLIHPCSMHRHFGISNLDYEGRKDKTVSMTAPYLGHMKEFLREDRQHDMADALCLIMFHCHKRKESILREQYARECNALCAKQCSAAKLDAFEFRGFGYVFTKSRERLENKLYHNVLSCQGHYSPECARRWGCIEMETPEGLVVDVTHVVTMDPENTDRQPAMDVFGDLQSVGPVCRWIGTKLCGKYFDDPVSGFIMENIVL